MDSLYHLGKFKFFCYLLLFLGNLSMLSAQPANDDCLDAIFLDNLTDYCSAEEAFLNTVATHDPDMPISSCTDENNKDVWFRFTPFKPNITISIKGQTGGNFPGGTLRNPAVELMIAIDGNCKGTLDFIDCATDDNNSGIATINKGGLIPGTDYLIRVQGTNNRSGTFQLCINNYTPPFPPQSDCDESHLLCDKSSFFVEKITGAGNDPDEASGTCLDCDPGTNTESSSTWYKWIAANNGSLTFILTPDNPEDDLDFALFELPDGLEGCNNKTLLRCMASGENLGEPFFEWQPCTGQTGLRINDGDMDEDCGCQPGDNNFAEAITMEEGKVYALLINNFSESEDGFTISFGGTGEFLGPSPEAEIIANDGDFCAGTDITFSGAGSSFVLGEITNYQWSFGQGASPAIGTGVGPHTIIYNTPGEKNVILTVETDLGCIASDEKESIVVIEACCEEKNGINANGETTDVVCLGERGTIDITASSISPILTYEWSNNQTTEDLNDLSVNDYIVTITNLATCEEVLSFTIDSVAPFEIITDITMPTCNGGTDGAINLNVTGIATPFMFNFGSGFGVGNTINNLSIGEYPVTVLDTNGCSEDLLISVNELELVIDSAQINIQEPSCFEFSNGRISINIANGTPDYLYNWNDGNGFVSNSNLNNIAAGTYQLDVTDRNLCKGEFDFVVESPEALSIAIDTQNISCAGAVDGSVTAIVEGGTGDYTYLWDNGQGTEQIINLNPGNYMVVVRDENDCEVSGAALVIEPILIDIEVTNVADVICFGDKTGIISVRGIGGNGIYEFSSDGTNFQSSPDISGLGAGDYTIFIKDLQDCLSSTSATISEPPPLTVDAGADRTIDLGYTTDFQTNITPFARPVDFIWSNTDLLDCGDCPQTTAKPPTNTTFVVTITDQTNCTATDSVMVFVNTNRPLFIPNAFSPNFDGENDRFTIFGGPATTRILELQIYDRWGNLVYNAFDLPVNDNRVGWDGTFDGRTLQPGVYAFVAKILFFDNVEEVFGGDITLVK